MKQKTFLTDTNFTRIPLFSTSKTKESVESKQEVLEYSNTDGSTTHLNISYQEHRKPSFYDRRVLAVLEYLYIDQFKKHFSVYKDELDQRLDELVREKHPDIKTDDITAAEEQNIIYWAAKENTARHTLTIDLKKVNDVLYPLTKTVAKKNIEESIKILSGTYMHINTSWRVKGYSTLETEQKIALLDSTRTELKGKRNKHVFTISLNPFHYYNLVNGAYTYMDLNLLNSFKAPSSGRLYEFLKPKLYKPTNSRRNKVTLTYDQITSQLRLKKHTKISYMQQQLKKPLDELREKGVIYEYQFITGLFGLEVDFRNNVDFFERYLKQLPKQELQEVLKRYMKLDAAERESKNTDALEVLTRNEAYNRLNDMKRDKVLEEYCLYQMLETD